MIGIISPQNRYSSRRPKLSRLGAFPGFLSFFSGENVISILVCLYGVFRAYLLIFVIINLEKFYIYKMSFLMKLFIEITLSDFFCTLFIFFFMNHLIVKRNFENRVCVGNPSMQ